MLFVTILNPRPDLTAEQRQEGLRRRLEWTPPQGIKMIGEYWLQEAPARVVGISEADSPAALFLVTPAWGDLFDIDIIPALTAEEGLRLAQQAAEQAAGQVPSELRR